MFVLHDLPQTNDHIPPRIETIYTSSQQHISSATLYVLTTPSLQEVISSLLQNRETVTIKSFIEEGTDFDQLVFTISVNGTNYTVCIGAYPGKGNNIMSKVNDKRVEHTPGPLSAIGKYYEKHNYTKTVNLNDTTVKQEIKANLEIMLDQLQTRP